MQNQKKVSTLVGVIIIIVAAVVLFGGIFTYQYFSAKANNIQTTDQTVGWKTYTNTQYGFEVQYPPNGFLTGDHYRFSSDQDYYVVEIRIPSPQAFLIDISPKEKCLIYNISSKSNTTVADFPAVKTVMTFGDSEEEYRKVYFENNKNCYSITLLGPGFENSEKMLETFKFTK